MTTNTGQQFDVVVVGAGYVGLSTACSFYSLGRTVACVDIDQERIAALRNGVVPILEPHIEDLVRSGINDGRLTFTVDPSVVSQTDIVFLAVPTPSGDDGAADLSYIKRAVSQIFTFLQDETVVVNKSTVPVGTAEYVNDLLRSKTVHVASNPEFLREGSAVNDFLNPDRIVVGATSTAVANRVLALFDGIKAKRIITDSRSAELVKYAANGFLAAKISFANELSALCERTGANLNDVLDGVGSDKRIGNQFLAAGPGWGGSCFPKDTLALLHTANRHDYKFELIKSAVAVNEQQHERMVAKVVAAVGGSLAGQHLGVLGLTFKAGTGDMRDSPAVRIVNDLCVLGATVSAYDPTASQTPVDCRLLHANAQVVSSPRKAVADAVAAIVLTEWPMFRDLDWGALKPRMKTAVLIDLRNIIAKSAADSAGYKYVGLSTGIESTNGKS